MSCTDGGLGPDACLGDLDRGVRGGGARVHGPDVVDPRDITVLIEIDRTRGAIEVDVGAGVEGRHRLRKGLGTELRRAGRARSEVVADGADYGRAGRLDGQGGDIDRVVL